MKEKKNSFSESYRTVRAKIIKKLEKPVKILKLVFGYGIMISLFAGGATILGYIAALCIGGEGAVAICSFIKQYIIPAITYTSTIMVLFGIILMYLSGETALSAKKTPKKTDSHEEVANNLTKHDEGER